MVGKRATNILALSKSAPGEMSLGLRRSSDSVAHAMRSVSIGGAPFFAASRTISSVVSGSARCEAIARVSSSFSSFEGRRPFQIRNAASSNVTFPANSLSS